MTKEKLPLALNRAKKNDAPEPLSQLDRAMITAENGSSYMIEYSASGPVISYI